MSVLPLYGKPTKGAIIQRAYGMCGQSTAEFELTPEEYVAGLRAMNDQLAPYAVACGYNMPGEGDGEANDDSGISAADVLGVSYFVAQLIADQIGKQLRGNATASRACSTFLAKYSPVPSMELGRNTIRGAGNRRWGYRTPFFVVDVSDDEVIQ